MNSIFIILCLVCVASADNYMRDLLQNEIAENCRSGYQIGKDVALFQRCFGDDIRNLLNINRYNPSELYVICRLDMARCQKQLASSVKGCLTHAKYTEIFDDPIKAIEAGQKYVCADGGYRLRAFITRNPHCSYHTVLGLFSDICINEAINEELFMKSFHTEKFCRERVESVACWVDAYNKCKDIVARDFIKTLGMQMLNETSCASYIRKKTVPSNLEMQRSSPATLTKKSEPSISSNLMPYLLQLPFILLSLLCLNRLY